MLFLMILSVLAAALLLLRLFLTRRELEQMTEQLRRCNERETGKKMTVTLFDRKLEALAEQINRQSERIVEAEARERRSENELRQAIANISHDIRTPLTSISGYIQLMETETLTPEERIEYLAIVKNRAKRLQALISDFFELSMIESLDYPLKSKRLGMTALLSEILVSFYDSFIERELTSSVWLPDEILPVYADESAVRRVVENLLINTINHATGHVVIRLESEQETVVLTIMNEAKNLSDQDVSLLFDRFYTADRTRSAGGSGLGLSIAKSLMSKMGGTLTAQRNGENLVMTCRWKLAGRDSV
ncbi:sensor histidine kinase [Gorillibacterium timonense]|uniref:sensor histidine kinase n=1 Tax=Gorillibacterium timonense TaxID=1689269 RepID=UPI00071C5BE2|nr:HAMP domain-containing sensor histidine kinase [Gorillibacterium timonense]